MQGDLCKKIKYLNRGDDSVQSTNNTSRDLKLAAYSLTAAEVKPALPLWLLSCHSHVDKLMFMLLQRPFMV